MEIQTAISDAPAGDSAILPLASNPSVEMDTQAGTQEQSQKPWPAVEWLPLQLSVALPILRFRVRDLLALNPGQTIATEWPNGDDLPLSIDEVQLAWVEMETVEQEMAVRITRLL